jgi:hypothetical protein
MAKIIFLIYLIVFYLNRKQQEDVWKNGTKLDLS